MVPNAGFSSLRIPGTECPILNLQRGRVTADWGRMIFHVADVDIFWTHLNARQISFGNSREVRP